MLCENLSDSRTNGFQFGGWARVILIAGQLIQGLALDGQAGPSTAYLLEAAPSGHRGFVESWQMASQGCATLLAGVAASLLTLLVADYAGSDWGWCVMFLPGLGVVPAGLVVRSHLPDTASIERDHSSRSRSLQWPFACFEAMAVRWRSAF
jgi:MFS family permease